MCPISPPQLHISSVTNTKNLKYSFRAVLWNPLSFQDPLLIIYPSLQGASYAGHSKELRDFEILLKKELEITIIPKNIYKEKLCFDH